jgi:phospholipid/cholesterol/gamma-HCH transport system ATP-binding protein
MLFQGAALFDSMTVAENIAFPLQRRGKLTAAEINRKVEEALDRVELPGTGTKRPGELSGGMRKRVGLARAIVYEPDIILYDEPTTGLDPVVSDSIDRLMERIWQQLKVTTIIVTHDMRTVRRLGQRIILLHQERLYVMGSRDEIFGSRDPIIYNFVNGISNARETS